MFKKWGMLVLILLLAFVLRSYRLGDNSMYGDELTLAYDTYSISRTGYSQTGKFLPISFVKGAGRPGVYIYASIPFIAIFGPTELGVRALSLLSGIGIVLLVFVLSKYFFNKKVAYTAAFLAAINPWEIALSRGGYEAHFALFLALLGITAFLYSSKKPWYLVVTAITFGLTMFTYPTYRFSIPFIVLLLLWYKGKKELLTKKYRRFIIGSFLILAAFGLLVVHQFFYGKVENRFAELNLLNRQDIRTNIVQKLTAERNNIDLPLVLESIFHNRVYEYSKIFVTSYFRNLDLNFLFVNGDGNPRHNPSEMGYFYIVEIIFIGIALNMLIKTDRKKLKFFAAWIFITPLGMALLLEVHGLRNSLYMPPLIMLSAYGLVKFLNYNKVVKAMVFFVWVILFVFMLERIYFMAPQKHAAFWLEHSKEASLKALKEKQNHDWVIIYDNSGDMYVAYAVYGKVDPNLVINQKDEEVKKYDNVIITRKIPEKISGNGVVIEVTGSQVNTFYVE